MHPSHSLVTIRTAKRPTTPLLYSGSLLCHVPLIVTLSGV
ncbi:BgTH12-06094 [Blumeria graminis f. sp. triticale]|uniref:Bgt-50379 n=2 Tax=Blumeria graminis TaxID=34373 RepID=A0A9X9MLF4_BLUGR|nr:BgTH12-06094 [Blumeria graminis f. sp. triticale]VDB91174.1 Bgt-50379 [Blumeria graminis f. sp. tritici]